MVTISRLGLDTKLKETTSASGSLGIFGLPISLGGSGSHKSEKINHTAHRDAAAKTLKVVPSEDVGTAPLIGLLGEKVKFA
ncbi:uncharacterized protein ColSpa_11236 [Colletotrichum spaethianum]|uniref:Uncharacterized protein n=1 Tax=Colletotrichum spaethianum TaxID=700344 RepID=A0AA37PFC6_9PEZI|nr:uncharacterized protein ColSpa_11236 [Colletotrichum spaethianum]GKT51055.1 hypothetical protein ColSpa_11236 [Colletotrichum spaethianum]